MLIEDGRIEIMRTGVTHKFVHIRPTGEPGRTLVKQTYMNARAWNQAVEDWLANYHEGMPLKKLDGSITTVGAYESRDI